MGLHFLRHQADPAVGLSWQSLAGPGADPAVLRPNPALPPSGGCRRVRWTCGLPPAPGCRRRPAAFCPASRSATERASSHRSAKTRQTARGTGRFVPRPSPTRDGGAGCVVQGIDHVVHFPPRRAARGRGSSSCPLLRARHGRCEPRGLACACERSRRVPGPTRLRVGVGRTNADFARPAKRLRFCIIQFVPLPRFGARHCDDTGDTCLFRHAALGS